MKPITLHKFCKLGRCWYSASSEHDRDTALLKTERFTVPDGFEVITNEYGNHAEDMLYLNGKPKVIHTDLISGLPYVLVLKNRKLDGKPYGTERLFLHRIED